MGSLVTTAFSQDILVAAWVFVQKWASLLSSEWRPHYFDEHAATLDNKHTADLWPAASRFIIVSRLWPLVSIDKIIS